MHKESGDEHLEIIPSYAYKKGKSLSVHHTFFDKVKNLEKVKRMITDDVPMDVEMQGTQLTTITQSAAAGQFKGLMVTRKTPSPRTLVIGSIRASWGP